MQIEVDQWGQEEGSSHGPSPVSGPGTKDCWMCQLRFYKNPTLFSWSANSAVVVVYFVQPVSPAPTTVPD